MKTYTRKCVKNFKLGEFEVKLNEEYLTSGILQDGNVMVFTKYWVRVPLEYFKGRKAFTK